MQNELRISSGGIYPRPQANVEPNFESCHGLQRRPRIAVEDVRDRRSSDPRFFGNPFNAPVAVSFTAEVDHHGLDHLVLGRAHVQAVGPAGVQARGTAGLRSHHAFTVAPGTSNTLLGVVIPTLGPEVGFSRDLVRPERRFEHRLGRRDGVDGRPPLTGEPTAEHSLANAGALGEVLLGAGPTPLDMPVNLAHKRLAHAKCFGIDGRKRGGVDVRPLGVGLARRRVGGHGLYRTGGRSGFRSGERFGGTASVRKGVAPCH